MDVVTEVSEISADGFVKTINQLRLQHKNNWYAWRGRVAGKDVEVKGFNTWLQIFRVDGVRHGGACDITPTAFKQELASPF